MCTALSPECAGANLRLVSAAAASMLGGDAILSLSLRAALLGDHHRAGSIR